MRYDPSAEEIADTAIACAHHVRRFGIEPKIALISHSDFGSADTPSALKMRDALRLLQERAPDLEVDGEMQADTALSLVARQRVISNSRLQGEANVLIFPNLDAGSTALQLTRVIADALPVGPILDRPGQARACADAFGDRARHRQHDRDRGGRGRQRIKRCFCRIRVRARGDF